MWYIKKYHLKYPFTLGISKIPLALRRSLSYTMERLSYLSVIPEYNIDTKLDPQSDLVNTHSSQEQPQLAVSATLSDSVKLHLGV